MEGRFIGRDIIARPSCPFCGMNIEKPRELATRMPNEMPLGACSCGAVYACDVTGHNLGSAMIEALVFGCDGDWDLAWSLLPEDDYLEKHVENYDFETHLIIHGAVYQGRRIAGTLYFIRLHEDVREVTEEGVKRRLRKVTPPPKGSIRKARGKKAFTKKEVEVLVKEYKLERLLDMAKDDKRILRDLQRLLYSPDRLFRWRAADTMGKVSAVIGKYDPGAVSKLLQRLFTAITDTAASSWGSLDAIGEIIGNSPEQFAGYIPPLYPLTKQKALLTKVLRALGKIAAKRPDLIREITYQFIPLLRDPDPEIRGYSAILLGNLGAYEADQDLKKLLNDSASVELYGEGRLESRTVGQLASDALRKLSA